MPVRIFQILYNNELLHAIYSEREDAEAELKKIYDQIPEALHIDFKIVEDELCATPANT